MNNLIKRNIFLFLDIVFVMFCILYVIKNNHHHHLVLLCPHVWQKIDM